MSALPNKFVEYKDLPGLMADLDLSEDEVDYLSYLIAKTQQPVLYDRETHTVIIISKNLLDREDVDYKGTTYHLRLKSEVDKKS